MTDLTPEERQRIYLEEKARLEVRRELKGQKIGTGKISAYIVLGVIGFLVFLYVIGGTVEQSRDAEFQKLTPEQRHAKTLRNCADTIELFRFKTYSEISEYDRRILAACDEQLKHPDQDIIKP